MREFALSDSLIFLAPAEHGTVFCGGGSFLPVVQRGQFPTTVPEAMAYGRPLVGFAGSGCVEEQICGGRGRRRRSLR
jgi:hypothetical protein